MSLARAASALARVAAFSTVALWATALPRAEHPLEAPKGKHAQ